MAAEPVRWTAVIRVAIVVEGETEEEFVKAVLAAHIETYDIALQPVRPRGRGQPSGGAISVDRLASHMAKLYWNFDFVTSLVDLYGFRGRQENETADELERRINAAINDYVQRDWDRSRVFSYVQKHEFEGLLFSEVDAFSNVLSLSARSIASLQSVRSSFSTPEDIDDGPATAPSKRIMQLVPGYRKRTYGPLLAAEIGLTRIRYECTRFDSWISRLESLTTRP